MYFALYHMLNCQTFSKFTQKLHVLLWSQNVQKPIFDIFACNFSKCESLSFFLKQAFQSNLFKLKRTTLSIASDKNCDQRGYFRTKSAVIVFKYAVFATTAPSARPCKSAYALY